MNSQDILELSKSLIGAIVIIVIVLAGFTSFFDKPE